MSDASRPHPPAAWRRFGLALAVGGAAVATLLAMVLLWQFRTEDSDDRNARLAATQALMRMELRLGDVQRRLAEAQTDPGADHEVHIADALALLLIAQQDFALDAAPLGSDRYGRLAEDVAAVVMPLALAVGREGWVAQVDLAGIDRDLARIRPRVERLLADSRRLDEATINRHQRQLGASVLLAAAVPVAAFGALGGALILAAEGRRARTAARRLEGRLAEDRHRLQRIVDRLDTGFALFDPGDRLSVWNRRYVALLPDIADVIRPGMGHREVIEQATGRDLAASETADRQQTLARLLQNHRAGDGQPTRYRSRAGRRLDLVTYRLDDGSRFSLLHDVTEPVALHQAAFDAQERLRLLTEETGLGLWEGDPEGRTLAANPTLCRLLEADDATQLIGRPIRDLIAPEHQERYTEQAQRRMAGLASNYVIRVRGLKGGQHDVAVFGAPRTDMTGRPVGRIATIIDLADLAGA